MIGVLLEIVRYKWVSFNFGGVKDIQGLRDLECLQEADASRLIWGFAPILKRIP